MRGEGGAAFEGREFTSMFERDSAAAAAAGDDGSPWIRDGVDAARVRDAANPGREVRALREVEREARRRRRVLKSGGD